MLLLTSRRNFFQSFGLSAGTVFNSLLGLFFYLIVARVLGPADFGRFSFLLGIGMLVSELADWGFDSAIVRFGSKGNLNRILGVALVQRLVIFLPLLLISGSYFLAWAVAFSLSLLALVTQSFLARQNYFFFVTTNVAGNSARLAAVVLIGNLLTSEAALVLFASANFLALVIGSLILLWKNGWFISFEKFGATFKDIIGYSKWMGGSFAVASLTAKIDVPVIYFLSGATAAGIYSSAQKLSSAFPQVGAAIEGVFAPKFSQEHRSSDLRDYFLLVVMASVGLLLLIPFSDLIVPLVFGSKYLAAIPVFKIFLLGLSFFFLAGPFSAQVLYRFGKSDVHFAASVCQLVLALALYWLLVPSFGAAGAAAVYAAVQLFGLVFYFSAWRILK